MAPNERINKRREAAWKAAADVIAKAKGGLGPVRGPGKVILPKSLHTAFAPPNESVEHEAKRILQQIRRESFSARSAPDALQKPQASGFDGAIIRDGNMQNVFPGMTEAEGREYLDGKERLHHEVRAFGAQGGLPPFTVRSSLGLHAHRRPDGVIVFSGKATFARIDLEYVIPPELVNEHPRQGWLPKRRFVAAHSAEAQRGFKSELTAAEIVKKLADGFNDGRLFKASHRVRDDGDAELTIVKR